MYCTFTTVDERGRPRSRILNPRFVARDGRPVGWALTGRTPLKSRHLAANPHASCSFWSPSQDTVFADVTTTWVEDEAEKEAVWRLDPWRVQVMRGEEYPHGQLTGRVWRATG